MVVYGHLIDPGHEEQYDNDHIQIAAPYCSSCWHSADVPGRLVGRRLVEGEFAVKAALVVWLTYALIDIGVLLAAGLTPNTPLVAVSLLTKLAAVYLGALVAGRRA